RTDRSEGLAALALVPLAAAALDLEDALGHIVAKEIAGNGVLRLVACEITCALADDDAELDLPVELTRLARDDGVVVWTADAGWRFVENDRLFRNSHASLCRVVRVIKSDGNEVADVADAGTKPWLARDGLHPLEVGLFDFGEAA